MLDHFLPYIVIFAYPVIFLGVAWYCAVSAIIDGSMKRMKPQEIKALGALFLITGCVALLGCAVITNGMAKVEEKQALEAKVGSCVFQVQNQHDIMLMAPEKIAEAAHESALTEEVFLQCRSRSLRAAGF